MASARLHLGDFPQAARARRGPGTARGNGRPARPRDFRAAIQSPGFLESAAGLAGYRPHPGLYQIVRT